MGTRVPDEHIWLQSKIRLKINHWRLSPEPPGPELAGFYVDSVRECVRKLAAGRRSVRLASDSGAGFGFHTTPWLRRAKTKLKKNQLATVNRTMDSELIMEVSSGSKVS